MSIFAKKSPPHETNASAKAGASTNIDFDLDVDTAGTAPTGHSHGHPRVTAAGSGPAPAYGIADAMQLMRSLPSEGNADLVTRVVRVTLSSVNVKLEDIIEDATRRQKAIQDRIAGLHGQIAELEEQLETRRREITSYETDLKETTVVKERLVLAEKSAAHSPAAAAHAPASVAATQPPPPPPPPSSRMANLPRATERE